MERCIIPRQETKSGALYHNVSGDKKRSALSLRVMSFIITWQETKNGALYHYTSGDRKRSALSL
eukprot:287204-Pelagomonas_calceolata.AAC.1